MSELAHQTYVVARKVVIALIGGTITLIGIAMIVLPGPAFIVLPAGLAILAIEFAWTLAEEGETNGVRSGGQNASQFVAIFI